MIAARERSTVQRSERDRVHFRLSVLVDFRSVHVALSVPAPKLAQASASDQRNGSVIAHTHSGNREAQP